MVTIRPTFLSFFLLLLLLHLPCFSHAPRRRRRRTLNSSSAAPRTSFFSFFKRLFSSSTSTSTSPSPAASNFTPLPPPSTRSPSSSTRSLRLSPTLVTSDIHLCSACGEVFQSPPLLERHRSTSHLVSELADDDENIVRIIFKTGWPDPAPTPNIHRILKIHNSPGITSRFEEYRERVKARAAAAPPARRDERCAADGNELLRFHCTTFVCGLESGVCGRLYCSLCGIIRSGFSPKMDGISTFPTSYAAHVSMPADIEAEFEFMHVRRAVLVCRVVAGRVGCNPWEVYKEDPGFDSVAGRGDGDNDEDEILVFNPRAVLPCFVIVFDCFKP